MTSLGIGAGGGAAGTRSWFAALLDVIGPDLGGRGEAARPVDYDRLAAMALIAAVAVFLVVAGQGAGRRGDAAAPLLFWAGVALLVVPAAMRVASRDVARSERLALLFLLAGGLFCYKSVYSPTSFGEHDEFLHWIATDDLMMAKRLFLSNPLLPVGPSYPALEIATSALVETTGLPLFLAATLLLAALRGAFVAALFLFFESVSGSARIAAIACLVYMGCSTFVMFDASFSYESLGIVLCVAALAAEATLREPGGPRARSVAVVILLLAALAVTHHLTAAYAAIYFVAVAVLEVLRRGATRRERRAAAFVAVAAVALPLAWSWGRGDPLVGYLGPVVQNGLKALAERLHDLWKVPEGDQSIAMPAQPLAVRLTTIAGVLLLSAGLATGFFRTLALAAPAERGWRVIRALRERRWRESRLVFLALLAFAFPVSAAFRLTVAGWEIGNRMGTFVFLAAGIVAAVAVVHFWQARALPRRLAWLPQLAVAVIAVGGVTAGSIEPIRGPYRAGGDSESIEAMSIATARWVKDWIGPGNRFVADRVNRLLLGGYGRQETVIDVADGVGASRLYEPDRLPPDDLRALARSDVDFLLVDMRLSKFPSVFGYYFDPWEASHGAPLSPRALLKFDGIDGMSRVFDNGWMKIYDARGLHGRF